MKSRLGFLASGEEFNLGPEMRLDRSELCVGFRRRIQSGARDEA